MIRMNGSTEGKKRRRGGGGGGGGGGRDERGCHTPDGGG